MDTFWIGSGTPSLKNSKQWTGSYLISSEAVQLWRKITEHQWILQLMAFRKAVRGLPLPLNVEFTFVRKSKHKFDYIAPCETMQDEMKYYGWIPDDNMTVIKPSFGNYIYDKHYAGCIIKILKPD